MGFRFGPGAEEIHHRKLLEASARTNLPAPEIDTAGSIILVKACDFAASRGSKTVLDRDVYRAWSWCIPFIWPCLHSTILTNPQASASVLKPSDVRLLELAGIKTNAELAESDTDKVTDRILSRTVGLARAPHAAKEVNILRKRVQLWQLQASILSDYQD